MANIDEYNLYLASWEHLYLIPNGVPAGLPNQIFSRHPWALILFEHLYCDENGLKGERNAAEQLGWTNSNLFVQLSSAKYDIITPINLKAPLKPFVEDISKRFSDVHEGTSITKAIAEETVSVDELFQWRLSLLQNFIDDNKLVLYDWPIARYGFYNIPLALQKAVKDVLQFEVASVPLTKDVNAELSPERKEIFDSLQEFEKEPLSHLRSGRISQVEYLELLKKRIYDYREVDMELTRGVDINLSRILTLRERFGKRDGWKLVQEFLKAYDRGANARELNEIDDALRDKLMYCFQPLLSEYGPVVWKISKGVASLLVPAIDFAQNVIELAEPVKEGLGLLSENIQFVRGEYRKGKKEKNEI